jgi:putative oxidoreductase
MQKTPIFRAVARLYGLLNKVGAGFAHFLLLMMRLNFGIQLFNIGHGKLNNHKDVAEFFASINIPFPDLNAWFVGGVEMIGGLCLALGLLTRPFGLMIAIAMSVAYLTADKEALQITFDHQDKFFQADPFFYLLLGVVSFAFGAGKISIDFLVQKFLLKEETKKTDSHHEQTPPGS